MQPAASEPAARAPGDAPRPGGGPRDLARGAVFALAVLTGINLFNYIDRNVVSGVEESVKHALTLSDKEAGSLVFGLVIVYTLTAPVFGTLGDRRGRTRLVALGVAAWSVATALAGLATGFWSLFAARSAVGVGEAAYGTIGPSLLADYYPRRTRGRAFAIFFAAIPVGYALGYVIGGAVDQHFGWRAAFYVAGLPGLALAALALCLRDPPRGAQDIAEAALGAPGPPPSLRAYGELLRNRSYVLTVAGYAAYTFALGALAFWMVPFLVRVRNLEKAEAAIGFGAIVVATGFVGTLGGGWLGDRLLRRSEQAYLWVSGLATLAAVPFTAIALRSPDPSVYYGAVVAAELLLFASTGPINTTIVNVVAPSMRATAVAASIFAIHIFGDAISPFLIGAISDALQARGLSQAEALAGAILVVPVAVFASGAIWVFAACDGGRGAARGTP
jgi:predicted MFS family arabinose efflux permease